MLINFTNHPSRIWREKQIKKSQSQFGEIIDLDFPAIDPTWNHEQIDEFARIYLQQIQILIKSRNDAVLIMGEQTFCFILICKLQKMGIPCYATTTKRKVSENSNKMINDFEFIGFRKYNVCM